MKKIPVAILGATGHVGQRFVSLLVSHPWFEVAMVAASPRSAGKTYTQAMVDKWTESRDIPLVVKEMMVLSVEKDAKRIATKVRIAFCALDMSKEDIKRIENLYASYGVMVVSNNSAHRWTDEVPMIIPEINPKHLPLIRKQQILHGWKQGGIVVKPNCSIQSYVPVLTALAKYKPTNVHIVSMQAISGAGKTFATWPEMIDNAIPYIEGEEEKSEREPLKIWGMVKNGTVSLATQPEIEATCVRIPVTDGHMSVVSVSFARSVTAKQIIRAVHDFSSRVGKNKLPSSPNRYITYHADLSRPQIRLDREEMNGMGISMGRLKRSKHYDWTFVTLAHNLIRGAAGGAILTAELLVKKGYLARA